VGFRTWGFALKQLMGPPTEPRDRPVVSARTESNAAPTSTPSSSSARSDSSQWAGAWCGVLLTSFSI
jgi:hypothetical protein